MICISKVMNIEFIFMIEVQDLTKEFGDITAVQDLSFHIEKSQIFSFLGPNGAGKTTTIRLLSSLISPTAGSITIDGKDIEKDSKYIRSIIGLLTETPGMYEDITAYENLLFFSEFYMLDSQKRHENIKKFLDMFGLWKRKDDLVKSYSKGMKQKLALARALLHEPKILYLDEPTAGLDPESAHMVRHYIESLKDENTTVFLCTHNLEEASNLSDKVCIIKKKIIKIASLSELQSGKEKSVEIVLGGDAGRFSGLLKNIKKIKGISLDANKIRISLKDPSGSNPHIVKALVENGADIIYVNEQKASLEDIYLDLIRDNQG